MITFKQFLTQKISYLISHFQKNCILVDYNGNQLKQINLSFQTLSDEYFVYCEGYQKQLQSKKQQTRKVDSTKIIQEFQSFKINQNQLNIKINDKDLEAFWDSLTPNYDLALNIEGQNISDQSILKLAELYENGICRFSKLKLAGNQKITQIGILKLGQVLRNTDFIEQINLHGLTIGSNGINRFIQLIGVTNISCIDLGLITNQSLRYFAKNLDNSHKLQSIRFGQNKIDRWTEDGKQSFQNVIRRGHDSKRVLSINVYLPQPMQHYSFISELNIITKKNRNMRVDQRQNEFKAASLNPNHESYYDPDNHSLNAYKFSVKSYLTNVFGSLLDEALYFLEKERRNQLRDEATFEITKQPINKVILEDICTADGSIIVLTKYLLAKIKQKQQYNGVS